MPLLLAHYQQGMTDYLAIALLTAGMQVVGFLGASHIPPEHRETLRQLGVQHLIGRMTELPGLVQHLQNGGA